MLQCIHLFSALYNKFSHRHLARCWMSADRTYHKHILVSVNVSSNPLAFRIAELLIWVFAETSGDVDKYKR